MQLQRQCCRDMEIKHQLEKGNTDAILWSKVHIHILSINQSGIFKVAKVIQILLGPLTTNYVAQKKNGSLAE